MNLKQKIVAACMATLIAGAGIFGANVTLAQTSESSDNSALIAQMMQMIEQLKQQIQQIIALIAQLKPMETCGNGICRFGETPASCAADCQRVDIGCVKEGMRGLTNQKCCDGLTANYLPSTCSGSTGCAINSSSSNRVNNGYDFVCQKCGDGRCAEGELPDFCPKDCGCGNGICETHENQLNCAKDCGNPQCAKAYWPCWTSTNLSPYETPLNPSQCCQGLTCVMGAISGTCLPKEDAKCGNGVCETGETAANCWADCGSISEMNRGYKEFSGKCTITNVSATNASSDGYLGSANVNFTFTPSTTPDISGTFLTSSASINPYKGSTSASYLGLYCLEGPYEPTYAQTLRCGVKVGAIFDCALTVASGGSGTPINIRFIDNPDCAKEGEYQTNSGNVVKKCCSGLATYTSLNVEEASIANSSLLCYSPAKGIPACKNAGTATAGFYYADGNIARYERCVDRLACNSSLNANDCQAAGGNFFADQKCYCNY